MILVTGANGKTGRAVIRALLNSGEEIRALVHRPEQIGQLKAIGVSDVAAGDMLDPDAVREALDGVRAVYHIPPAVHPDEAAIGRQVIDAAKSAGIEHFVCHSVLHPQISLPHHRQKLVVENYLIESGLPFTIMQPAMYMQNILQSWPQIEQQGIHAVPYGNSTRLSMIDLKDVGEAASVALTGVGHKAATYELCGPEALSAGGMAVVLEKHLDRPVRVEVVPVDVWERRARSSGMGDYQVNTLATMFRYYAQYGFEGNPNVLSWLLGRTPTDFASFVDDTIRRTT